MGKILESIYIKRNIYKSIQIHKNLIDVLSKTKITPGTRQIIIKSFHSIKAPMCEAAEQKTQKPENTKFYVINSSLNN